MAHFKLLQHPLGKTKGSVLLSTVKYTHPPSSSSALPLSSQPAQELQSSPTAWRVRFTPGPVPGTLTLAVEPRLGKDAALEQHTHAVWIPSECHLLHAGIFILFFFFSWLPTGCRIPGKATFTGNPTASNLPSLVYVYKEFCTVFFAWKIGCVIKESY